MDRHALKSAAEAAVKQGEELLREYERKLGRRLPPFEVSAQSALRAHYFALMKALKDPDLYSAILQDFLEKHKILLPRGVFKRDLCSDFRPAPMPYTPDGPRSSGVLLAPRLRGRPKRDDEAWQIAMVWLEMDKPTWGDLANALHTGRRLLTPQERKKLADKLRQQVKSVIPLREKNPA